MTITAELRLLVKALESLQGLIFNAEVRYLVKQMIDMVDQELAKRQREGKLHE